MDFLGNKIEVGDTVVYMMVGYRSLVKGKVFKVTAKCVFIGDNPDYLTRQFQDQVVVV